MPIFKGIPPGKKINLDGVLKPKASVMCEECTAKFKKWAQYGGTKPEPCAVCKERLKNKMLKGRYPDR
ncbi:MAG: hypothetical protein ACFFG0_56855 [Candidatus Thorarchaeota archaeon]